MAHPTNEETDEVEGAPPYEGRTTEAGESGHGGDKSVERQLEGASAPKGSTASPGSESPVSADEVTDEEPESPHGVGESTTRRGEDVVKQEGKEPGREDGPREHEADRPTGYSDERDVTGTDPQT